MDTRFLWLCTFLTLTPLLFWAWGNAAAARTRWPVRFARLLGLVVPAFPPARWAARSLVAWLYTRGPDALARALMPSRNALPLSHYLDKSEHLLRAGLVLAWVGSFFPLLVAALADPQVRAGLRRPRVRFALAVLGLALASPFLWFGALQIRFRMPHPVFYTDCRKVWGHRGHPEPGIPENTLASFRNAFDLGAPGVEMDVFYLRETGRFLVGRKRAEAGGHPLDLEQVFAQLGHRGRFWIDLKTVRNMTPQEARETAARLKALAERYHVEKRIIVESEHPENLRYFAQAGLHTSYWIFNVDREDLPQTTWEWVQALTEIQQNYVRGGFSAISMDYHYYRPIVARFLWGARIHLFTVNDEALLRHYVARDEVRIILTDGNYFHITACP